MVCKSCGKKLTDSLSIERGYGPVCWERLYGRSHRSRRRSQTVCMKSKSPQVEEDINIPGQMSIEDYLEFMA